MNGVFEQTVGDSLARIVESSRTAARLVTEAELQDKWTTKRANTIGMRLDSASRKVLPRH